MDKTEIFLVIPQVEKIVTASKICRHAADYASFIFYFFAKVKSDQHQPNCWTCIKCKV